MPNRPYLYHELTNSICTTCYRKVEAKIIEEDGKIYMVKRCLIHGPEKVLISTDVEYYHRTRKFIKPSEMPLVWNTRSSTDALMTAGYVQIMRR